MQKGKSIHCAGKEDSFTFNIFSLKSSDGDVRLCQPSVFLISCESVVAKINRRCRIMKKSSFILPSSKRVSYFQSRVLYNWAIDKEGRGLSWGFLTAGRVHFRPFVTAVIFPEIPYAKVMFWLFYPLLLIYFLKSRGEGSCPALSHHPTSLSYGSFGAPQGGNDFQWDSAGLKGFRERVWYRNGQ